jgi:hypothetical protein
MQQKVDSNIKKYLAPIPPELAAAELGKLGVGRDPSNVCIRHGKQRESIMWQVMELSSKTAICQVTLGAHHTEEVAVRAANVLKALHIAGYSKEQLEYAKHSNSLKAM